MLGKTMSSVFARIAGIAINSPAIHSIDDLRNIPRSRAHRAWKPRAKNIPMMLRRRLSTCGKAVASTLLHFPTSRDEENAAWVFASRYGDIENTLTQLREIAADRPISPTTFATHVHNGIGGLIAIGAQHHGYQTSLAGSAATVSQALYCAQALLVDYSDVFLSIYDTAPITSDVPPFAVTLHLVRETLDHQATRSILEKETLLITEYKARAKGLNPPLGPQTPDSQAEIYAFLAWLLNDEADFTWQQNDGFWVTCKNQRLATSVITLLPSTATRIKACKR